MNQDILLTDSFEGYEYTYSPVYLGKHIKELRLKEKISQNELGLLIGARRDQIRLIEAGTHYFPLYVYHHMAYFVFKVSLSFLLTGKENAGVYIGEEDDEKEYSSTTRTHSSQQSDLTPEEEVEQFMRGERDYSDLSADAETWFQEEIDDD